MPYGGGGRRSRSRADRTYWRVLPSAMRPHLLTESSIVSKVGTFAALLAPMVS